MAGTKPSRPWWSSSKRSFNGLGGVLFLRSCLFHIQSSRSNQPAHTHSLSLELDFLITAIRCDVKNSRWLTLARFWSWKGAAKRCCSSTAETASYNRCSFCCSVCRSKRHVFEALHAGYRWVIPRKMIRETAAWLKEEHRRSRRTLSFINVNTLLAGLRTCPALKAQISF